MTDQPTPRAPEPEVHRPFTDDGVTYCGWDKHDGCGEVWPCSTVRAGASPATAPEPPAPDDLQEQIRQAVVMDAKHGPMSAQESESIAVAVMDVLRRATSEEASRV